VVSDYSGPGIFNVLDYNMRTTGATPPRTADENRIALQSAIDAAQASLNPNGAIVLIPSFSISEDGETEYGNYLLSGPINVSASGYADSPLLICGTGSGTELVMQGGAGQTLFDVIDATNVSFQDLTINGAVQNPYYGQGTAFNFQGGSSHKLFRLNFANCQFPIVLNGTEQASVLSCFATYDASSFPHMHVDTIAAVQVVGGSDSVSIGQSEFRWFPGHDNISAPNGYYGISIDEASDVKITDTQISEFSTGISIQASSGTTSRVRFRSSRVSSSGMCVEILPAISDLNFTDCHFQASGNFVGPLAGIAIGIGSGNANDEIDTVRFVSCSLTGNSLAVSYGMQIGAAQNVQILGGSYSGNGDTAGIAIVGGASEIQIVGANCVGVEFLAHSSPQLYQLYGISITAGQNVQIIGTNCSGNGLPGSPETPGAGIFIDGAGGSVGGVRIVGAICTGSVFGQETVQEYGIYVNDAQAVLIEGCTLGGSLAGSGYGLYLNGVSDVTVKACDLYGNTTGIAIQGESTRVYVRDCNVTGYAGISDAVEIATSLSAVEVTNCAGYNDQRTLLASAVPSGTFNGISVDNYYGPTAFYVTNYIVTIDSESTHLSTGGFTLAPGELAVAASMGIPGTFVMIGT